MILPNTKFLRICPTNVNGIQKTPNNKSDIACKRKKKIDIMKEVIEKVKERQYIIINRYSSYIKKEFGLVKMAHNRFPRKDTIKKLKITKNGLLSRASIFSLCKASE